jgi:hypothetical protein
VDAALHPPVSNMTYVFPSELLQQAPGPIPVRSRNGSAIQVTVPAGGVVVLA